MKKPIDHVTIEDYIQYPVWEYINEEDQGDETWATPVFDLPVDDLTNRVIGIKVTLNNSQIKWASISNIDIKNPYATEQFVLVCLDVHNKWFPLARYFDAWYKWYGPQSLAEALNLSVEEIFPIHYQFTQLVKGNDILTQGYIYVSPRVVLSKDELRKLSLRK